MRVGTIIKVTFALGMASGALSYVAVSGAVKGTTRQVQKLWAKRKQAKEQSK